ncbi:MAG: DNA polymerase IV [Gammaproteobacteria bacterium]|nr:DNA polymerase IV [Gammaproteobacteria bacterium]
MRKIIHIDMDAFYASVEQRDHPELRGQPVVVGGRPNSRGVVAAASYEARQYGIRSAMPAAKAHQLCPHAIFVKANFETYRRVSATIQSIFQSVTPLVEPLSLDEAFLDVTDSLSERQTATELAADIRQQIKVQTELNASAGISYNKFLAKIASDINKPNGQFVITPERAQTVLDALPIGRFHGIGRTTEQKCHNAGIETGFDLRNKSLVQLQRLFGSSAQRFFDMARGIDHRPVRPHRERKSIGIENTFSKNLESHSAFVEALDQLSHQLIARCERQGKYGQTLTLKVRFGDFTTYTRQMRLRLPATAESLLDTGVQLLGKANPEQKPLRLIGLSISDLITFDQRDVQLNLRLE